MIWVSDWSVKEPCLSGAKTQEKSKPSKLWWNSNPRIGRFSVRFTSIKRGGGGGCVLFTTRGRHSHPVHAYPTTRAGPVPRTTSFTRLMSGRNLLYLAHCPGPVFLPKLPMVHSDSQPVAPGGKMPFFISVFTQSSVQGLSLRYRKGL